MKDTPASEYRISISQLRPGVFVRLERTDWFSHPFLFSSFKITDESQIQALRLLGVREVVCVPEKSDVVPLERGACGPGDGCDGGQTAADASVVERLWTLKKERIAQYSEKRRRIARCEEHYTEAVRGLGSVTAELVAGGAAAVDGALALVRRITRHFLSDAESVVHLMNVMEPTEHVYSHPLNVAILAMLLGRYVGLGERQMEALGMGALFHDLGKELLEKKLVKKRGRLTRAETRELMRHPGLGLELASSRPGFPRAALPVIGQHHEHQDGSGYPVGVGGEDIDRLARMTSIANVYDNLCNPAEPEQTHTPYEALSYMFSQLKERFDVELLSQFIRCMGVYPPGTVVRLDNGSVGVVMSVNQGRQLRPRLLLHDPLVPKREALIVDLAEEPELAIERSVRPAELAEEVLGYLNPRTRITYYVDHGA
ncbi:MAG: HD-GYP domain-containing protein [Desulfovibrionaceae bacterium]